MATFSGDVAPTNDTDANFRLWINFFHNSIITSGGWIQTADTGQINFTTVTTPGAINTKAGYAIYRMNDSLQATKPVFLKVAFGSGSSQQAPGIWFAIGSATDGAGTLIDANDSNRAAHYFDKYSQSAPAISRGNFQTTLRKCFGSVSTDRFAIFLWEAKPKIQDNSGSLPCCASCSIPGCQAKTCASIAINTDDHIGAESNYSTLFSIERGRDWDGATIGDYIIVMWSDTSARVSQHIVIDLDHSLPTLGNISGMIYVGEHSGQSTFAEYHDNLLVTGAPATAPVVFRRNTFPIPPGVNVVTSRYGRFKFDMGLPLRVSNDGGPCDTPVGDPCLQPPNGHCPTSLPCCTGSETGDYISGRTVSLSPFGVARTYRVCAGIRMANFTNSGQDAGAYVHILYE